MLTEQLKVCSSCKEAFPFSDFHKDKSKRDGFCSYCKMCKSQPRDRGNNLPWT